MLNLFKKKKDSIVDKNDLMKEVFGVESPSDLVDLRSRTVLLQIYKIPEKTSGGILMPNSSIANSVYDNRIGRVLSVGPNSYDDIDYFPNGPLCSIGEWIVYWRHDASILTINGIDCAILPANKIMFATKSPELISTNHHVGK